MPNFISNRGLFRKGWLQSKSDQQECSVKIEDMRTLKFRPSFPTCINRKVSDGGSKKTLEMGDFPLHILETRRKERLAELKAECLELKHQLSGTKEKKNITLIALDSCCTLPKVPDKLFMKCFYFVYAEHSLQAALLREEENSVGSNNDKGARILSGMLNVHFHFFAQIL